MIPLWLRAVTIGSRDLVVTRIGERAFHDKELVSVIIPDTSQ